MGDWIYFGGFTTILIAVIVWAVVSLRRSTITHLNELERSRRKEIEYASPGFSQREGSDDVLSQIVTLAMQNPELVKKFLSGGGLALPGTFQGENKGHSNSMDNKENV